MVCFLEVLAILSTLGSDAVISKTVIIFLKYFWGLSLYNEKRWNSYANISFPEAVRQYFKNMLICRERKNETFIPFFTPFSGEEK